MLQTALIAAHEVESRPGQLARGALDEPQVCGQGAELGIRPRARPSPVAKLREPGGVELARLGTGTGQLGRLAGGEQVTGGLQVLIDRLTGDEQVHDLGRALEDPVGSHVAHELFGRC